MKPIYSYEKNIYNLDGFEPKIIDEEYLKDLGFKITDNIKDRIDYLKKKGIL